MDIDSLRKLVSDDMWFQYSQRIKEPNVVEVLHKLFESIITLLAERIDDIKTIDGKAISFFSKRREFLTINIMRNNLRVYVHPPSQAYFDIDSKYDVEKLHFWESSFHKKTSKYRGLSVWISNKKYLRGIEKIIKKIPISPKK